MQQIFQIFVFYVVFISQRLISYANLSAHDLLLLEIE